MINRSSIGNLGCVSGEEFANIRIGWHVLSKGGIRYEVVDDTSEGAPGIWGIPLTDDGERDLHWGLKTRIGFKLYPCPLSRSDIVSVYPRSREEILAGPPTDGQVRAALNPWVEPPLVVDLVVDQVTGEVVSESREVKKGNK